MQFPRAASFGHHCGRKRFRALIGQQRFPQDTRGVDHAAQRSFPLTGVDHGSRILGPGHVASNDFDRRAAASYLFDRVPGLRRRPASSCEDQVAGAGRHKEVRNLRAEPAQTAGHQIAASPRTVEVSSNARATLPMCLVCCMKR